MSDACPRLRHTVAGRPPSKNPSVSGRLVRCAGDDARHRQEEHRRRRASERALPGSAVYPRALKHRPAYAIVRLDHFLQGVAADADRVVVKRIMWDKRRSGGRGCPIDALVADDGEEYYVQYTRVDAE
jgi:hypothetical protein